MPVSRVQTHHRAGLVDIALSGGAHVRRIVRMSRFDLVIFDCDGVLVDSERLVVRTEAEILSGLGWPLTDKTSSNASLVDRRPTCSKRSSDTWDGASTGM